MITQEKMHSILSWNSEGRNSPQGYTLSNGIGYCCVGIQCNKAGMNLVQEYGKEARELYTESLLMAKVLKVE